MILQNLLMMLSYLCSLLFLIHNASTQSIELQSSFDINFEIENNIDSDHLKKQTLTLHIGSTTDTIPSDFTVRVYCDTLKIFESLIDESLTAFEIDISLLQMGKNELDVAIFSSSHGMEFGRTTLYVYKKSKDEVINMEELEEYDDAGDLVETNRRNNRYFNFILGCLGFAGIATQIVLKYGDIVDAFKVVADDFEIPDFEVPLMALPPSIPIPEEVVLSPPSTQSNSLIRHIIARVFRKWAPRATLLWAGSKTIIGLIAKNSRSVAAAIPPEVVEHVMQNEVVRVAGKNIIFAKLLPRVWRTIAVTALTVGLNLLGIKTKGRFFNQNAGAPEFRRIF